MAKLLAPITIAGVTYRVLRLDGARGPRYLLRSAARDLTGLFPRGAEPMRLYAAPLVPHSAGQHPLARLDFFDGSGTLLIGNAARDHQ